MVRRRRRRRGECAFFCRVQNLRAASRGARASRVPICEECRSSLAAPPEKCEICGPTLACMTVYEGELPVGYACQRQTYAFERARSYGVYDEPLGEWFAERLAEVAKRRGSELAPAVAVAVPSHRERQPGCNQPAGPESWFAF
jgi:predicted amidophosphoribosyltransferase